MRILEIQLGKNALRVYNNGVVEVVHGDQSTSLSLYDLNAYIRMLQLSRNLANAAMEGNVTEPIALMEVDFGRASPYNGFLGFVVGEPDRTGAVYFKILLNPHGDGVNNIGKTVTMNPRVLKPYVYQPPKERLDKLLGREVKA